MASSLSLKLRGLVLGAAAAGSSHQQAAERFGIGAAGVSGGRKGAIGVQDSAASHTCLKVGNKSGAAGLPRRAGPPRLRASKRGPSVGNQTRLVAQTTPP